MSSTRAIFPFFISASYRRKTSISVTGVSDLNQSNSSHFPLLWFTKSLIDLSSKLTWQKELKGPPSYHRRAYSWSWALQSSLQCNNDTPNVDLSQIIGTTSPLVLSYCSFFLVEFHIHISLDWGALNLGN